MNKERDELQKKVNDIVSQLGEYCKANDINIFCVLSKNVNGDFVTGAAILPHNIPETIYGIAFASRSIDKAMDMPMVEAILLESYKQSLQKDSSDWVNQTVQSTVKDITETVIKSVKNNSSLN